MKKCLFFNPDFKLQSKHMMNKISCSYFTDKSMWPQMVYGKPRNTELIYPLHYKIISNVYQIHYKKIPQTKLRHKQKPKTKPKKQENKKSPQKTLKKQNMLEDKILRIPQVRHAAGMGG